MNSCADEDAAGNNCGQIPVRLGSLTRTEMPGENFSIARDADMIDILFGRLSFDVTVQSTQNHRREPVLVG